MVIKDSQIYISKYYLNETNLLGIATKALSATHESILPDYRVRVPTYPAIKKKEQMEQVSILKSSHNPSNHQ